MGDNKRVAVGTGAVAKVVVEIGVGGDAEEGVVVGLVSGGWDGGGG